MPRELQDHQTARQGAGRKPSQSSLPILERHFYSIPYQCVGKKAKAVYDCHTVEIWVDLERIAIHRRIFTDGYTTEPSHMPPNHIAYMRTRECNAAYFLDKSRLIGPHAHEVVENVLKSPYFVQQAYKSCHGILRLAEKYGNERMEQACLRLGTITTGTYTRLKNILEHGLDSVPLQQGDTSYMPANDDVSTGRTGCGKSFLACALGRQACLLGHRVEYYSMNRFIEKISMGKADGTLLKVINHIEKNALVIFDDFGLQPLDDNSRLALLQILEDCYERKSVIITSQLPIAKWYDYIKEPTLADAIMDRLTANARRIELKGQSLRRKSK